MLHSVCLIQGRESFFGGGGRDFFQKQIKRFMRLSWRPIYPTYQLPDNSLNSFIFLTYHLSYDLIVNAIHKDQIFGDEIDHKCVKNLLRFLINNITRIFEEFCYIGFLKIRIILKLKRKNERQSLFSLFFYSLICYSYSLHYINQSGFLYSHSSKW